MGYTVSNLENIEKMFTYIHIFTKSFTADLLTIAIAPYERVEIKYEWRVK